MMLKIILFVSYLCVGLNAEEDCDFSGPFGRFPPNLVKQARLSDECLNQSREIFKSGLPFMKLTDDGNNSPVFLNRIADINDAFEFFGDLIQYLDAEFMNIPVADAKEIIQKINRCSSLVSILLKDCRGDAISDLSGPFPNITYLQLTSHPTENFTINADSQQFHEIFPNLTYLAIGNMKSPEQWKYIQEIPASVLFVNFGDEICDANEAELIEFIRNNSHVRGLEVNSASRSLLNKINNVMGNLSALNLNGLSQNYSNDGDVHFGTLFTFKFTSKSKNDIPDGIYLDNIYQIDLEIPNSFSDEWVDFLKNQVNKELNMLRIKTKKLTKEQLLAIVESLSDLGDIEIDVSTKITIDEIEELLKTDNKLKRFHLYSDLTESEAKELVEKLEGQWNVEFGRFSLYAEFTITRVE